MEIGLLASRLDCLAHDGEIVPLDRSRKAGQRAPWPPMRMVHRQSSCEIEDLALLVGGELIQLLAEFSFNGSAHRPAPPDPKISIAPFATPGNPQRPLRV
jgi:hypothetical protein